MKKLIIIILFTTLLNSCAKNGIKTEVSNNNPQFEVTLLFEYDSIKMYRFFDNGDYHYFCKNYTSQQLNCGKGCHYEEKIETK